VSARPIRHAPETAPAVRAQVDLAIAALADLPPRYGFVVVVTDTRDEAHHYYSDLTPPSAVAVLADVVDALTPLPDDDTTNLEN